MAACEVLTGPEGLMEIMVLDRTDNIERLRPAVDEAIRNSVVDLPLDTDVVLRTLRTLATSNRGDVVLLCDEKNIRGGIALLYSSNLVGPGKIANEILFYVSESCRGNGLRLIRAARKLAKVKGCDYLMLSHAGRNMKRSERLFRNLGYKPFGASYLKEL